MRIRFLACVLSCLLALHVHGSLAYAAQELSDKQVKEAIISESLASYPGNCPCPFSTDRAGRACGKRSAYSKPGGYSPICYPSDVTPSMIQQYRQQH